MKFFKKLKRTTVLMLAIVIAATSSLAVYATVDYDSSKDPVVSLSGMKAYISEVIQTINTTIADISSRLSILELAYESGGGPSSGTPGGATSESIQALLDRISALESKVGSLEDGNEELQNQLNTAKAQLEARLAKLEADFAATQASISSLSDDISSLRTQLTATKTDLATLSANFKQIADISTKLDTLTYKVNSLTNEGGDIAVLKSQFASVKAQFDELVDAVAQIYEVVFLPYGSIVHATKEEDTVLAVLRSGSAVAISPYTTPGTIQGLNDLTSGTDLVNGDTLPLFHNIMIPRGGNDGRGIMITSFEGAYIMLGGDFTIVTPQ
jgi:uncharacterized coiled-coil protein SlyX